MDTLKVLFLDASMVLWRRPARTAREHVLPVRVEMNITPAIRAWLAGTIAVRRSVSVGFVSALI